MFITSENRSTPPHDTRTDTCLERREGGGARRHLITTQTEHKCVLDSCRSLEQEGYDVTYLPVSAGTGMVDVGELERAMRDDTLLVSVMAVNNEIGTRQPIEEIGRLCRGRRVLFHTDGA